jgi:hypothetical protein
VWNYCFSGTIPSIPLSVTPSAVPPQISNTSDCSSVTSVCEVDATCSQILNAYTPACTPAFTPGGSCSEDCTNNYLKIIGNDIGRWYYTCHWSDPIADQIKKSLADNCFDGNLPPPPTPTTTAYMTTDVSTTKQKGNACRIRSSIVAALVLAMVAFI